MGNEYTETVFSVNAHYTVLDIPTSLGPRDYTAMEFRANMKRLRKAKKWNQDDLAEQLGVAQATVTRWEGGKREPSHDDLEKIAKAFGVSVATLFREKDEGLLPNADDIARMIQRAMDELPLGVAYADYPRAVSTSLHEQLMQFQAVGGFRETEGEETDPGKGALPLRPTNQSDEVESHNP